MSIDRNAKSQNPELLSHTKQKLRSKSDIFDLNTPCPLLKEGERPVVSTSFETV